MSKKGRYGQFIRGIFTIVDFAILNAIFLILYLCLGESDFFTKPVWLVLNVAFLIVESFSSRVHERRVLFADRVTIEALRAVIIHAALSFAMISFLDIEIHPLKYVKFFSIFAVCLCIWWISSRKLLKLYRTHGFNFKRIIIVGGGAPAQHLLDEMMGDPGYGYRIMGLFDDVKNNRSIAHFTGGLNLVEQFIKDNIIDEMYCTITDEDVMARMIKIADNNAIDFYYVPQFNKALARKFELSSVGNIPILALRPNPLKNLANRMAKRIFDVIVSTIVLICSPIVLIPVAVGIKISSPGPIFFRQKRTGYRGKEFWCYKFRTMRVNKDSDNLEARGNEQRNRRFGDFLRL